jgi:hypothetical protein
MTLHETLLDQFSMQLSPYMMVWNDPSPSWMDLNLMILGKP